MSQTIFPLQHFGIGDCIFTQTLINKLAGGNSITWGVQPYFVDGLKRAYPSINWVDYTTLTDIDYNLKVDTAIGDKRIIPIRWSVDVMKVPYSQCMSSKYVMFGKSWERWKDKAMFARDAAKEQELYNLVTKLLPAHVIIPPEKKRGRPKSVEIPKLKYNLINRYFRSDNSGMVDIKPDNDYPCIEMTSVKGYSLFDWAKIIEGATEIHVVNSAITFILELMDVNMPIHLYCRKPDEVDFKNTEYIFTKPYILHV